MNKQTFINTLNQYPDASLTFISEFDQSQVFVHSHLTEVKSQNITSIDCGGHRHHWANIVIQLWAKNQQDDGHRVNSGKALSIIQNVSHQLNLQDEQTILFEYQNAQGLVAHYHAAFKQADANAIVISLSTQTTECKASQHSTGNHRENQPNACCAPIKNPAKISCCG